MDAAGLYDAVKDAIVLVTSTSRSGWGSGFFVDRRGIIVTNGHVVEDSDDVLVQRFDTTELPARLIWSSRSPDLAVLLVAYGDYPALPLASQESIRVGEEVLAIGHPVDVSYRNTVTAGIVSGVSRLSHGARYVQIDAAINPGNSGGPVVSSSGAVIGVSTWRRNDAEGLGFAVPSGTIQNVLGPLLERFESLSAMQYCVVCGHLDEPGSSYCGVCGRSFARNVRGSTASTLTRSRRSRSNHKCGVCGQSDLKGVSLYCPTCGTRLDRGEGDS